LYVTVVIKPVPVDALKTADLVQAVGATVDLITGDEFDRGVIGVVLGMVLDAEA